MQAKINTVLVFELAALTTVDRFVQVDAARARGKETDAALQLAQADATHRQEQHNQSLQVI